MKHWYVGIFVPLVAIIPLILFFLRANSYPKGAKLIVAYLCIGLLTNCCGRLLGIAHLNNLPLLHLYTIIEFLILMWYFRSFVLSRNIIVGMTILMVIFPVYSLMNMFFIQQPFIFNSYARSIAAIILMASSLYCIYKNLNHTERWANYFSNWVSTGLLIYFGSALFQFALSNIIYTHISLKHQLILGSIHANLVMAMYLLFTGGFIYAKQQ